MMPNGGTRPIQQTQYGTGPVPPGGVPGGGDVPGGGSGGPGGPSGNVPGDTSGSGAGVVPTGFVTAQSPAQGSNLGAYDVWANQAFGGPTDAENNIYGATLDTGGQSQSQGNQLIKGAMGLAANPDPNGKLQTVQNAAANMYMGKDQVAVPINAQQGVYQSMIGPNGGYDANTKAAIANEGNAALNAQEAAARDKINNAAARTGSPLGAYGAIVDVNQNIGDQRSAQARQNQILFANEQQRQKEAGASGLGQNAGLLQNMENAGANQFLTAQGQQFNQGQTAGNQANQFVNDQTSRNLAALNSANQQNAQQRGYQQAGGAGLTNILQGQMGQQNQLYSMLASVLGNKQGESSDVGTIASDLGIQLS